MLMARGNWCRIFLDRLRTISGPPRAAVIEVHMKSCQWRSFKLMARNMTSMFRMTCPCCGLFATL